MYVYSIRNFWSWTEVDISRNLLNFLMCEIWNCAYYVSLQSVIDVPSFRAECDTRPTFLPCQYESRCSILLRSSNNTCKTRTGPLCETNRRRRLATGNGQLYICHFKKQSSTEGMRLATENIQSHTQEYNKGRYFSNKLPFSLFFISQRHLPQGLLNQANLSSP